MQGGDTALILAAHEGHVGIVNLLLQYPIQINLKNNVRPLLTLLEKNTITVKITLHTCFLQTGFTALIIAAARNYTDLCAALLDHGANVNMKDKVKYEHLGSNTCPHNHYKQHFKYIISCIDR